MVGMPVHAIRHAAAQDDPRRLVSLHVLNVSRGGVGAISQELLEHKESLVLLFPPLGPGCGEDAIGQVVRCTQSGDCYAIGIAFNEPWPERADAGVS